MSSLTLVQAVARLLGDTSQRDRHTNTYTAGGTSLTIATGGATRYPDAGFYIDWLDDATYDIQEVTVVADTALTIRGLDTLGATNQAHAANAIFRVAPRFFSFDINKALDDALLSDLYPRTYAVYEAQLSPTPTTSYHYSISADAERVLAIYQKPDSGITDKLFLSGWSQPTYSDTALASTKKTLRIPFLRDDNNTIFVQYIRKAAVADLTDAQTRAVEYGACHRLLAWEEARNVADESKRASGGVSPAVTLRTAAWFRSQQDEILANERARLMAEFPRARVHVRMPHVR